MGWAGGRTLGFYHFPRDFFSAKPQGVHLSVTVGSNYYFLNIEGRQGSKILV